MLTKIGVRALFAPPAPGIRLDSNPRTNSVLVETNPDLMRVVEEVIRQLDQDPAHR